MFAAYYAARDADLVNRKRSQGHYAKELLTELLNRAHTLEPTYLQCVEAPTGGPEQLECLEKLAFAVDVFLRDVHEATERGRRASLYAVTDFGVLDDACQGDGDLVPAEVAK